MDVLHPRLMPYLEELLPPREPVLAEMEDRARRTGFPIVGPVIGQMFYLLTRLAGARTVFELGSGYGYSTAWFAMAVRDNGGGTVHHVVWDEGLSADARGYFARMDLLPFAEFHIGEAVAALRAREDRFDVIFNDIDKESYPASLPVIKEHLRSGGLLLTDNVLWHGAVLNPKERDGATEAIRIYTRQVFADPDFVASVVPLRDGVLVARRT
ncbi:MAG: O-methyltransferase [Armatimonadota bacterium]|nr:O-methyltransferase [Armatimonadota bacterium]MDR5697418.1 O-methyltransferase [Armatimonadota bacterium]